MYKKPLKIQKTNQYVNRKIGKGLEQHVIKEEILKTNGHVQGHYQANK